MGVSNPQNITEMRRYILTRLGYPVINVEVAPEQLDVIIYDTVQDAQRYMYGDAVDLVNTTLVVSAGVSEYYVGDCGIEAAYDIALSHGFGGINTLFSPMHVLLYNDWVTNGNYPGGGGNGYPIENTGLILSNYEISMEYLESINQMFGKMHVVKYNIDKQALIITPTPQSCGIATLKLYCKTDAEKLYNHPLIKKLCVARTKIQWGLHLGKYVVTMPDGSATIGMEIMNRGYEEEEKIFEDMRKESQPIDFFID